MQHWQAAALSCISIQYGNEKIVVTQLTCRVMSGAESAVLVEVPTWDEDVAADLPEVGCASTRSGMQNMRIITKHCCQCITVTLLTF